MIDNQLVIGYVMWR